MEKCPNCGMKRIIKYGIVKKKQRYRCQNCFKIFRPEPLPEKCYDREIQALQLYLEGISVRWIEEFSNKKISNDAIRDWIDKISTKLNKYKKRKKEDIYVESPEDIRNEILRILHRNESKIQSGVLVIGLDVLNPFSCLIKTRVRKNLIEEVPNVDEQFESYKKLKEIKIKPPKVKIKKVKSDELRIEDFR